MNFWRELLAPNFCESKKCSSKTQMTSKSKNKGLKLVVEECDASQRSIALESLCRTESSLGVTVIKFLKQKEISNFILIQI